jgi:hypothetical protein
MVNLMEYCAEDLIAYKLEKSGLMIAKPKFDIDGTDLIAFLNIDEWGKFGRIQCKGRSLDISNKNSKTYIEIQKGYLTEAFFCIIYFNFGIDNSNLYLFTSNEIKQEWKMSSDNRNYVLNIYSNMVNNEDYIIDQYRCNILDSSRISMIKELIRKSNTQVEKILTEICETQEQQIMNIQKLRDLEKMLMQYKNSVVLSTIYDDQIEMLEELIK